MPDALVLAAKEGDAAGVSNLLATGPIDVNHADVVRAFWRRGARGGARVASLRCGCVCMKGCKRVRMNSKRVARRGVRVTRGGPTTL